MLEAAVHKLATNWAVEMAEVAAAWFGLIVAQTLGFQRIVLECNALKSQCSEGYKEGADRFLLLCSC